MQSLRSPRANCSSLAHIYGDIKCIAMGFRTLSISCVKRSANFAAHSLAKYARQIVEELVWLEECPSPPSVNTNKSYHWNSAKNKEHNDMITHENQTGKKPREDLT